MKKNENKKERGTALIAVLSILLIIGLLTASAVSISQLTSRFSKAVSDRALCAYYAEGAGSRLLWLLMADKRTHPARRLGERPLEDENENTERFLADGTKHKWKIYNSDVECAIFDMAAGIDISGKNPTQYLQRTQDSIEQEGGNYKDYQAFLDCLKDYVDSDDFVRMNGAEKNEYAERGLNPLPRNDKLQFREEILLIPKLREFFHEDEYGRMSAFQIIPPKGTDEIVGKKSFFAASIDDIIKETKLPRDAAEKIIEAKKKWMEKKIPLSESIPPAQLTLLKEYFSFMESGFYTFIVKVRPKEGIGYRMLFFSLQVSTRISGNSLIYYDWLMY